MFFHGCCLLSFWLSNCLRHLPTTGEPGAETEYYVIARYRRGPVMWAGNAAPGVGVRGQQEVPGTYQRICPPIKRRS